MPTAAKRRPLTTDDLRDALRQTFDAIGTPNRTLLLPPDATRLFSRAGELTVLCRDLLGDRVTDIMPALGTHSPMKPDQLDHMFPGIPHELFRPHRWRDDVVTLGEVPAEFVSDITGGVYNKPWKAQVNKLLRDGGHDLIFSLGQVVPHEVIGMANYNKKHLRRDGRRRRNQRKPLPERRVRHRTNAWSAPTRHCERS